MHQNDVLRDTNSMWLHFCISDGDKQVFHGDMVILNEFFSSLFYHCLMKLLFLVDKNPLGPYNYPLFQSCCKYGR